MTMQDQGARWIVLRTSPQRTLVLARSLADAGLEAWTPVAMVSRRLSRRSVKATYEAPMTPTFVFAPADALRSLQSSLVLTPLAHPAFSVMRINGEPVQVRDDELQNLRNLEERSRKAARKREVAEGRANVEPFAVGEEVHLNDGAFTGLKGKVETSDQRHTWLVFSPSFRMKIETFQLRDDGVAHA